MGYYLTDLADVLRAAGLNVVEIDGWKTRGWRGGTTRDGGLLTAKPLGGLVHHTGTPASALGNYPTLNTIIRGRSDVAGPLAQLGLGRDGTWYVVAAGRANHSGAVDDQRYFNAYAIGVEAEHPGGGAEWPAGQYDSYVKGCAALGRRYGITWRGHKEAAVPKGRKPDPTFGMDKFRADVAAGGGIPDLPGGGTSAPAPLPPRNYVQRGDTGPLVGELQRLLGITVDEVFGPVTEATVRWYQADRGLSVDGIAGPDTFGALRSGKPSRAAGPVVVAPGVPAPAFPLPEGWYFGPKSGPKQSVSGYFSYRAQLAQWQQRMKDRGWDIEVDGLYGDQTGNVAEAFQREKGLTVDRLIGPQTWGAAWTQPVTR